MIWILNIIASLMALGAAAVSALLAEVHGDGDYNTGYRIGSFAGALFVIVGLPVVVSFFAKGNARLLIRGFGIIGLAVLITLGNVSRAIESQKAQAVLADAERMNSQLRAEARKQIEAKGNYTPNTEQAQQNIEKLQNELTGDSEMARGGRDMLKLSSELVAKAQASAAIENTGTFTLNGVKTPNDLAEQTAMLTKLRASDEDVVDFLQNFDQHCREVLAADNLSSSFIDGAIHGARSSGHIDLLTKLWQTKVKLTDDYLARQDLLKKEWGRWEAKDDKMLFADDSAIADYNAIMQKLGNDASAVTQMQLQVVQ